MTSTKLSPSHRRTAQAAAAGEDRFYEAIRRRDPSCDGSFVYAVATTGVYCRPSCPARQPKRENISIHKTYCDAEAAGFRPCKRCNPAGPSLQESYVARVAEAARLIEEAEDMPRLADLARKIDMSPSHFQRVFKAIAGVTPKDYAIAHRQKRLRRALQAGAGVTTAIYEAGFNSSGRLYAVSDGFLGMTPSQFRSGGTGAELRFAVGQCSLGAILVAASSKGIAAILLGDDPEALVRDLEEQFPQAILRGGDKDFEHIVAKVVGLIEAPRTGLDLPLDVQGTAFQHRVWKALSEIPSGATATYSEIARRIGMPKAVRAVAAACAANKIAVAIPCHRVVRTGGALSGYRWGIARKRRLLEREKKS